jgi:hypothetical protein
MHCNDSCCLLLRGDCQSARSARNYGWDGPAFPQKTDDAGWPRRGRRDGSVKRPAQASSEHAAKKATPQTQAKKNRPGIAGFNPGCGPLMSWGRCRHPLAGIRAVHSIPTLRPWSHRWGIRGRWRRACRTTVGRVLNGVGHVRLSLEPCLGTVHK